MRKVIFSINTVDEKGLPSYGLTFLGVMTSKNLYAKRLSSCNWKNKEYIKVKLKDTKVDRGTLLFRIKDIKDVSTRCMTVSEELGLDDPRISEFEGNEDILAKVDEVFEEVRKKKL